MKSFVERLAARNELSQLNDLYGITESDVQSTAIQGYPVSGQPTGMPSGVAADRTPETSLAPQQQEAPALDTQSGEQAVTTDGEQHIDNETEFFGSLDDVLSTFQGILAGCEGSKYDSIRTSVEGLKAALAEHLQSYRDDKVEGELEVQDGGDGTGHPAGAKDRVAALAQARDQLKEGFQRGQYFDADFEDEYTVYFTDEEYMNDSDPDDDYAGPSADYIYFADLAGNGDYIEFVINGRVWDTLPMPEPDEISRFFTPMMDKWLNQLTDGDVSAELKGESRMIILRYSQEVKHVQRRNASGWPQDGWPQDDHPAGAKDRVAALAQARDQLKESFRSGQYFEADFEGESTVYYVGPDASPGEGHEPSADYIYFADLAGNGDYIEFVINGRVWRSMEMPEMGDIGRKFQPMISEWLARIMTTDFSPELENEMRLITLAYSQEVAHINRQNHAGWSQDVDDDDLDDLDFGDRY